MFKFFAAFAIPSLISCFAVPNDPLHLNILPPPNFNYQSGDSLAINVTFKNVPNGRYPGFKVIHGSAEKEFVKRGDTTFQFNEKLTSQSVSLDLDLAEGNPVYTLYKGKIQPQDYAVCGVSSLELNFDIDFSNTYTGQVVNVERKITEKCVVAKYGFTISNGGFIRIRSILDISEDGGEYQEKTYPDGAKRIQNTTKDGNNYQENTYADGSRRIVNTLKDGSEYKESTYSDGTKRIENTTKDEKYQDNTYSDGTRRIAHTFKDGSKYIEKTYSDKSRHIENTDKEGNKYQEDIYSDGTKRIVNTFVDGSEHRETTYSDGTRRIANTTTDGNTHTETIRPDGNRRNWKRSSDVIYGTSSSKTDPNDDGQVFNEESNITEKCVIAKNGSTKSNSGCIRIRSSLDNTEDGGEYQEKTYPDGTKCIVNITKDGNSYQENTYADGSRRILNTLKDGSEYKESTYSDGTKRIRNTTKDEKYEENIYPDGTKRIVHTLKDGSEYKESSYSDGTKRIRNTTKDEKYEENTYPDGTKRIVHTLKDGSKYVETTYSDGTRRIANTPTDSNTHTETIRPDGNRRNWKRSSDVIYGTSSSSKTDPNDDGAVLVSMESSGNRVSAYSSADMLLVLSAVLSVLHKLFH
ncbi:uncharacterized protein F59B2.12-like [Helicoverpa zea]|uniref:uncharacterized protein F59B2.12-like n=1 Tax=Helicoverpa zea TaxID=7113 RepID=UPI001F57971F|nr:uncharacterized protein F59B2.12-like [Helicoverpa zea]